MGIATSYIRKVNLILKKNRSVLESLNPNYKSTIHKKELIKGGFNFNFHTSMRATKTGKTFFFCYDHGYSILENGKILLVKKKE